MAGRLEHNFTEPTPKNVEIGDLLLDIVEYNSTGNFPIINLAIGGIVKEITSEKIKTNKNWECKYSQAFILKKDNTYLIGKEIQSYLNELEQLAQPAPNSIGLGRGQKPKHQRGSQGGGLV